MDCKRVTKKPNQRTKPLLIGRVHPVASWSYNLAFVLLVDELIGVSEEWLGYRRGTKISEELAYCGG